MRGILLGLLATISPSIAGAAPAPAPPRPTETYGDWTVGLEGSAVIASVGNNAGSVFGTICGRSSCSAFFNPKITCDPGGKYPALVNSPAAAFSVNLLCEKIGSLHIYTAPLEGGITEAMSVGGVLGIAFPMQSGQFQVARFSLTGAARATARASQVATGRLPTERQSASDNSSL